MRRLLSFAHRWFHRRSHVLDEEIRAHIELETEENIARGMPPDEARYAALRSFGNPSRVIEHVREMRRIGWVDRLWQDLSYASRVLRRTPLFTLTAILTLVIGIGANATMLDVLDRLFVRAPAGVRDAERTVRVWLKGENEGLHPVVPYATYAELRDGLTDVLEMAAYGRYEYSFGVGPEAVKVRAVEVSDSYFAVLGTRPAVGALLGPPARDVAPDARIVLSYGFWQRQYGGDPQVVGRAIRIGAATVTIAGVAEAGFIGPHVDATDVWLPLTLTADWRGEGWRTQRNGAWYQMVGRLRSGSRVHDVEARAAVILRRSADARGDREDHTRVATLPLVTRMPGNREFRALPWIAAVAALVFLVACVNTAMLFYTRGLRRAPEIATRLALGASRGRVLWQLVTEALLVSCMAGVAAAVLMAVARDALATTLLPNVGILEEPPDARSVLLVGVLALLAGLVCGAAPALRLVSAPPPLWRGAQPPHTFTMRRKQVLFMVAAQTALVVPALVGAGLFLASLRAATSVDLGFDPRGLFVVTTNLGTVVGGGRADQATTYEQMLERARQLPGVRAAALTAAPPALRMLTTNASTPDGREIRPNPYAHSVTAAYFETMRIPLTQGRGFGPEDDRQGAAPVVVVSETLARHVWPAQSPLGQCLMFARCLTVIGVAADGRLPGGGREGFAEFYLPLRAWSQLSAPSHLVVRVAAGTRDIASLLRNALGQIEGGMPYIDVMSVESLYEPWIRSWRVAAVLFSTFAVIGLLLAAVGLYGIVGYVTALQHREAAIRVALGASPGRLVRALTVRAIAAVLSGLAVGTAVAALGARGLASQLHEVSPQDPVVFAAAAGVLVVTCVLAAYFPARRLHAIDPATLLRAE